MNTNHWLTEARRIGFNAELDEVVETDSGKEHRLLSITYTKARKKVREVFNLADDCDKQAAIFLYGELDRLYAARRKAAAKSDAMRSVGMVRTPYGWE